MSTVNRSLAWEMAAPSKVNREESSHARHRSIRPSSTDRQSPYQVIKVRGSLTVSF